MTRWTIFFLLALLFLGGAPRARADAAIGTILEVEGTATVKPSGGKAAPAGKETPVHMQDVIATGPVSRAFILFVDDTQITLAENTALTVNEYVFDPDNASKNKASYNVLRGAFQYLSGLIAKKPKPDVTIDTPYGAIGIRGTKIMGGLLDGVFGIFVDEGKIGVKNGGGEAVVGKNEGTNIESPAGKPGKPGAWPPEKLERLRAMFRFRDDAALQKRIRTHKEKHDCSGELEKRRRCERRGQKNCDDGDMRDLPVDDMGHEVFVPDVGGGSYSTW